MPYYLLQAAYTPEAWANLVKNPQDRTEAIRPIIEGLGGKVITGLCPTMCRLLPFPWPLPQAAPSRLSRRRLS